MEKVKRETKRKRVIQLFNAGKSIKEIMDFTGIIHSNNIYRILKEYKTAEELKSLKVNK